MGLSFLAEYSYQVHCKPFHCKNCRFPLCPISHCNFTAVWAVVNYMQWTTVVQFEIRRKLYFLRLENCNFNSLKPTITEALNLGFQQFCMQLNTCIFFCYLKANFKDSYLHTLLYSQCYFDRYLTVTNKGLMM